jgi:flagellar motor switch protein FliM
MMTNPSSETTKPIDPIVLARLTGSLGDVKTIAQCCSDVAALECQLLGDVVREEMQIDIGVEYAGHVSGLRSAVIAGLGSGYTLVSASQRNWCSHFVIATRNSLPIAMIAQLLGDTDKPSDDARVLTSIEGDIATLLLSRIAGVLRLGLGAQGAFEPVLSACYPIGDYAKQSAETPDCFAAAVRLQIKLGSLTGEIVIVIPQSVLLKTTITRPSVQPSNGLPAPADAIADHVLRSQIDLCARIKLTPLKLGSIARLRLGDTIPFEDIGDIGVDMDANGKLIYRCEFGRSGDSYSVKIKSNVTPDGNILKKILDN